MNKIEYLNKIVNTLSEEELANFNKKLYYNPEHIQFYEMFNMEEYDNCWKYVEENRECLKN